MAWSAAEDRVALVSAETEEGGDSRPVFLSVRLLAVGRRAAWLRLALSSLALLLISCLLVVQLALFRDASRAARLHVYSSAVALALLAAATAAPAWAAAVWRGGRVLGAARMATAAALWSLGILLVLSGRHRNRLACNVQDPLIAVLIVFSLLASILNAKRVRLRPAVSQVIICLGLFIGVSYQACNKYRCHGDDHSDRWSAAVGRRQHVLWVSTGCVGLALVCTAGLLMEAHFHRLRKNQQLNKKCAITFWDLLATNAYMTTVTLVTMLLLFWVDLVPGFGESGSMYDQGSALLRSLTTLADSRQYLSACLLLSGGCLAAGQAALRLLSAGRPVFQLACLVSLGVLLSQLWWSLARVDGHGGWRLQPRVTGETVTAAIGGALACAGLAAWAYYRGRPSSGEKSGDKNRCRDDTEFQVYRLHHTGQDRQRPNSF